MLLRKPFYKCPSNGNSNKRFLCLLIESLTCLIKHCLAHRVDPLQPRPLPTREQQQRWQRQQLLLQQWGIVRMVRASCTSRARASPWSLARAVAVFVLFQVWTCKP